MSERISAVSDMSVASTAKVCGSAWERCGSVWERCGSVWMQFESDVDHNHSGLKGHHQTGHCGEGSTLTKCALGNSHSDFLLRTSCLK